MAKTYLLCILDGFGLNPHSEGNAIALANTPNFDRLLDECPSSTLITYGSRVGLPDGQMGNSEVGHLNIGAGRVVEQWLQLINRQLRSGEFKESQAFKKFVHNISNAEALHLVGLYSDGGVHSHLEHLKLFLDEITKVFSKKICLHLITDGRDTSPTGALEQIRALEKELESNPQCEIATVSGRYYAMDRDKRWERLQLAYDAIIKGEGPTTESASAWLEKSYSEGVTDEFIVPALVNSTQVAEKDGLVFWNFRADRMRQIVNAFTIDDFTGFERERRPFALDTTLCFTDYDPSFGLNYLFDPMEIDNHLGDVIASAGLKQLRTAETEKYPHVTYFLNGGKEEPLPGEDRDVVPSPRDVSTYDLKPEMSAFGVRDVALKAIRDGAYDCIVVNFANCDMVGHTGVIDAAVKAVEVVDQCLGEIIDTLDVAGGEAIIIADHGNAEQMINYEDGTPHTAHTTHPVPVIVFGVGDLTLQEDGALCDVAPTLLKMMGIEQPEEMTGQSLF